MFTTIKIWFWYLISLVHNFFNQLSSLFGGGKSASAKSKLPETSAALAPTVAASQQQCDDLYLQGLLEKYYLQPMEVDSNPQFESRHRQHFPQSNIYSEKTDYYGFHISRYRHGVSHAVRVWYFTGELHHRLGETLGNPLRVIAEKAFGVDRYDVTHEQRNILSIAPLLHDSARKAGGEDHWDHLSGANVSLELVKLGVSPEYAYILGKYTEHKDNPGLAYDEITQGSVSPEAWNNEQAYPYSEKYNATFTSEIKADAKALLELPEAAELRNALLFFSEFIDFADFCETRRCHQYEGLEFEDKVRSRVADFYMYFRVNHPKVYSEIRNHLWDVESLSYHFLARTGDLKPAPGTRKSQEDVKTKYNFENHVNAPLEIVEIRQQIEDYLSKGVSL